MPLSCFHPVVQSWFRDHVGAPTQAQQRAWPVISAGKHLLVTAPTGSGKTLAAFLWALDGLLTGRIPPGALRILYVSPMRALNNDVRRNLLQPLSGLREALSLHGYPAPDIQVMTRSGDTPADERQRMVRRPPEILITTPESLNILLTSQRGRAVLRGLRTVILDEVHAVIGTKRGVHLITAVDRLVPLCGEFQRVALSATVRPLEGVAAWVGGYQQVTEHPDGPYQKRNVSIVQSSEQKRYAVRITYPSARASGPVDPGSEAPDDIWPHVTGEIRRALERNRSSLVFANSKRMVEKLTRFVNDDPDNPSGQRVHSHHGALSREIRAVVEQRLKEGSLRGIVATNSLELGIDIGALDEVLLVQTPPSVASAVQRIGRAGHGVGQVSRGTFLPLISRDVLDAAVVARSVLHGNIEQVQPIRGALDVLAQVVLSMTACEPLTPDALHARLRTSDPYHDLPRRHLDLVIDMLTGRYASARIRELQPLVSHDRVDDTLRARRGAELLIYMSGGTIPDRGYFRLRRADSMALIGELDEEFVWERSVGDSFTLGVQSWRVEQITHNDVLVSPAKRGAAMAPFWRAESRDRTFELSESIATFLEGAEPRLDDPAFHEELTSSYCLEPEAVKGLIGLLKRQKRATAGMLPHRHRLIAERAIDPTSQGSRGMLVLHTLWGGRVNRPFAMALQAAWEESWGYPLQVMQDDDCIVLDTVEELRAEDILRMVPPERVEELLRSRLDRTGYFGARFREAAGRALLLPRAGFRHRTPLWLSRLKGKKLLAAVAKQADFPIVLEAWRECLQDAFDLPALQKVLDEIRNGEIHLATVTTSAPSPLASNVTWQQTNQLMYDDDTPEAGRTRVGTTLLRELTFATHGRPRIPKEVAERLQRKLQRLEVGWSPRSETDLLDWVKERVVIPAPEWKCLGSAIARDHQIEMADLLATLGTKIVAVSVNHGPLFVAAAESLPRLRRILESKSLAFSSATLDGTSCEPSRVAHRALDGDAGSESLAGLVEDLLRFHAPVEMDDVLEPFGLAPDRVRATVESLVESQKIVLGAITEGAKGEQVCDGENLERLLRMMRAGARPDFETQPVTRLPSFLAQWQGVGSDKAGTSGLRDGLERLFGLPLSAELWETEIFPARVEGYCTAWLDALFAEAELQWVGATERKVAFVLASDRELFLRDAGPGPKERASLDALFPHPAGRFPFEQLLLHTGEAASSLTPRLWFHAWKGRVTSDGYLVVRRGVETDFGSPDPVESGETAGPRRVSRRGRLARWNARQPSAESWYRLPDIDAPADALEQDEIDRDRIRVLMDRWGVLFRQLLDREDAPLRWNKVFRTLRIMELSGEIVSGHFFDNIQGLQFAAPAALDALRRSDDPSRLRWMSASDPASVCGLGLKGIDDLPRRVPGNHLVLQGERIVVISESKAKRLTIRLPAEDPSLPACLGFLRNLIERQVRPLRCLTVESINGQPASVSPYRAVLEKVFHTTRDRTKLKLMRSYGGV